MNLLGAQTITCWCYICEACWREISFGFLVDEDMMVQRQCLDCSRFQRLYLCPPHPLKPKTHINPQRIRGDVDILMVGDAGVGKQEFGIFDATVLLRR